MRLHELKKDTPAQIIAIDALDAELEDKLREIGFAEGDDIEIIHFGPLATKKKPICARLNQTLIALREDEAAAIHVEIAS
ncbi:MAG: FeoA family protein [Sphingomonadales bacterium]|jgi:ferrous iron transport protein A